MILRITEGEVAGTHSLKLTFNDGAKKTVDVTPLLDGPVFEPLKDPTYFARATMDTVCGTIVWPNGPTSPQNRCTNSRRKVIRRPVDGPAPTSSFPIYAILRAVSLAQRTHRIGCSIPAHRYASRWRRSVCAASDLPTHPVRISPCDVRQSEGRSACQVIRPQTRCLCTGKRTPEVPSVPSPLERVFKRSLLVS